MIERLKQIWHDPVWSKVIAGVILAAIGWGVLHLPSISATAVGLWFAEPVKSTRLEALNIALTAAGVTISLIALIESYFGYKDLIKPSTTARNLPTLVQSAPPQPQQISPSEPPGPMNTDLRTFFATRRGLRGHFAELEEFDRQAAGKAVKWIGTVYSVKTLGQDATVYLTLDSQPPDPVYAAGVSFPNSFRERLFARRKGDVITITGTVTGVSAGGPEVDGESLEVHV